DAGAAAQGCRVVHCAVVRTAPGRRLQRSTLFRRQTRAHTEPEGRRGPLLDAHCLLDAWAPDRAGSAQRTRCAQCRRQRPVILVVGPDGLEEHVALAFAHGLVGPIDLPVVSQLPRSPVARTPGDPSIPTYRGTRSNPGRRSEWG